MNRGTPVAPCRLKAQRERVTRVGSPCSPVCHVGHPTGGGERNYNLGRGCVCDFPGSNSKHCRGISGINHQKFCLDPRYERTASDLLMVGIRSPTGLVVGSCTSHPGVLGSIPKREEPGKTGAPCIMMIVLLLFLQKQNLSTGFDRCLHRAQAPRPWSPEVPCLQRRLPSRLHGLHRFDQHQCLSTWPHARHVCSRRLLPRHLNGPLPLARIWTPESLQGTSCLRRRWTCSYP